VHPLQVPDGESFQDYAFAKTLAMLSEASKGDVAAARKCLADHIDFRISILKGKEGEEKMGNKATYADLHDVSQSRYLVRKMQDNERLAKKKQSNAPKEIPNPQNQDPHGMSGEKRSNAVGEKASPQGPDSNLQDDRAGRPSRPQGPSFSTVQETYQPTAPERQSWVSGDSNVQPGGGGTQQALYEHTSGAYIDRDHHEVEAIPDDPEGASYDDLQILHTERNYL
jgi:hypothetical protein